MMNKVAIALLTIFVAGCSDTETMDDGRLSVGYKWDLFKPEPGIHCVVLKAGYGSSLDCYPAPEEVSGD